MSVSLTRFSSISRLNCPECAPIIKFSRFERNFEATSRAKTPISPFNLYIEKVHSCRVLAVLFGMVVAYETATNK